MAAQPRPPVVTIMGHVDHGKTTLLDYIRSAKVAAGEAGGITQHIGAYQTEFNGKKITFIDTPGHAAFNKMRQRGAQITDIVVLVVAADDGVKPQTLESLRFIKESNVPFLVAITKIDKEGVRTDVAKGSLAENGVLIQEYGGEIEAIELSAKTGKNVDKLLETILVMADLLELQADPSAPLEAAVIESAKDPQKGSVARVIVKQGTLRVRQEIEAGEVTGRIKSLTNERGEMLTEVLPGAAAEILGLTQVPEVGSQVRDTAATYPDPEVVATQEAAKPKAFTGFDFDFMVESKPKLKLIVCADVSGTLEAIQQTIDPESVDLLSAKVGEVSEYDVELAQTTGARIIAFHVPVSKRIKILAKAQLVKIKEYDVIYHLIEDLQKIMLKILEPTIDEVVTGEAEIVQIFDMRGDRIAGVRVKTGKIRRHDLLHLKRGDEFLVNPVISSMKHGKEDVIEVNTKNEAGLTFKNKKLDFQVGDILVAYTIADE